MIQFVQKCKNGMEISILFFSTLIASQNEWLIDKHSFRDWITTFTWWTGYFYRRVFNPDCLIVFVFAVMFPFQSIVRAVMADLVEGEGISLIGKKNFFNNWRQTSINCNKKKHHCNLTRFYTYCVPRYR